MYKIDLEHETVENIVKDVLVKDYKFLCEEIRNMQEKGNALSVQHQEDLNHNIFYKNGLEIVLHYYFSEQEAKSIIQEQYSLDFIE